MRLQAQKYVDSLPLIQLRLELEFPVNLASSHEVIARTNHDRGWIKLKVTTPGFALHYKYRAIRALALKDGIHVFFSLERGT
jgi:hypothetical protein